MDQFPSDQSLPYVHHPSAKAFDRHVHFGTDDSGATFAALKVGEFVREMTEKVMSMEESLLAGVIADEMRRRGYTVIAPHDRVDPPDPEVFADDPVCSAGVKGCNDWHGDIRHARQGDVDRHAEKQGCSYSDAWNYYRDMGYDMSHVDNWDAR